MDVVYTDKQHPFLFGKEQKFNESGYICADRQKSKDKKESFSIRQQE